MYSIGRFFGSGRGLAAPLFTAFITMIFAVSGLPIEAEAARHDKGETSQPAPMDDFERRVRDYLLRKPEVIVEALQKLQEREQALETDEVKKIIAQAQEVILRDSASPVGGNPDGDVTVVEFFDYNCPYCRKVMPVLEEAAKVDPRLRIVYKEWPILGPGSIYAARAALAAVKQGKYLNFHKAMMRASGQMNEARTIEIAKAAGLDVARLKADMDDPAINEAIGRTNALAKALRITGTPAFVIGKEVARGAIDLATMKLLIAEARKKS